MPVVAPGLEPVAKAFEAYAEADPTYSAQLAVHHRGELVLDLTAGALEPDTLLPVFSSSKGAAGIVVALLVERGLLDLDARVASYWPEFAAQGKTEVTVRQALSHQAGLNGVDGGFSYDEVYEHTALAARLAAQRPLWRPGAGFVYHAATIGTLADELVRRTDGRTLAKVLADDVAGPRDADVHLGLAPSGDGRLAPVLLPTEAEIAAFMATLTVPPDLDGLGAQSTPPGGAIALLNAANTTAWHRAGAPGVTMTASARGLSTLYAGLRHDLGAPRLLSEDTVRQVAQVQVSGLELSSGLEARFGVVFQAPCPRWPFGSYRAFGHDGAGGSLGFCDPEHDLAFGYTVQRVPLPTGELAPPHALSRVLRDCLSR